jgi:ABC-type transporter MlaC component
MRILAVSGITAFTLLMIAPISLAETPDKVDRFEQAAIDALDEALKELLAALSGGSARAADRLSAVEDIVRKRLDYPEFSRFALARYRGQFSEEQLARYECEFDAYLSNYIGSRLVRYQQEKIQIFKATVLPNRGVVLSTRITGGNYDQAIVTFLMREVRPEVGEWRAVDVAFEGTKVRKLLRAQFQSVLEKGGPEHLIAMLREKTPGTSPCATGVSSE